MCLFYKLFIKSIFYHFLHKIKLEGNIVNCLKITNYSRGKCTCRNFKQLVVIDS